MSRETGTIFCAILAAAGIVFASVTLFAESPDTSDNKADGNQPAVTKRVSIATARERAKLIHNIYATTMDVMHHRYFHGPKATIPARAMEDVFKEIERQESIKGRWISVNTNAMSIDHDPQTEFERNAASAIGRGKGEFELIKDGVYRRAGAIPLTGGCLSCHLGFGVNAQKDHFAALIITIPVNKN